ncbi:MAG TPA: hypothetical protein VH370_03935 [Humisphaera sp.]|nr:hypothetical protein [Humisphaera sp.]
MARWRVSLLDRLAAVSTVLLSPMLWLARRRRERVRLSVGCWAFNGAAVASGLWIVGLLILWQRSYSGGGEWELGAWPAAAPKPPPGVSRLHGTWSTLRWLGWSNGHVQFLQRTVYSGTRAYGGEDYRLGYWLTGKPQTPWSVYYALDGSNWFNSGFRFYSSAAEIVNGSSARRDQPPPFVVATRNPLGLSLGVKLPQYKAPRWSAPPPLHQPLVDLQAALANERNISQFLADQSAAPGREELWRQRDHALNILIEKNRRDIEAATNRSSPQPLTAELIAAARQDRMQSEDRASRARATASVLRSRGGPTVRAIPGTLMVVVSIWILILPALVVPLLWIRSALRHAVRRRRHACPACGYDLRATPNRCPECGTVPAAEAKGEA